MSKINAQIAIPYITTLEDEDFPVAELTESEIIPVMEKALSDLCSKNSLMYGIILGDPELNEIPVSTWFTNFYEAEYNLRNGVSQTDDFRIIEGIGPKIDEILHAAGITSFDELSKKSADELREILLAQSSRNKMFDPTTWPEQAQLAAEGKMDDLNAMKESLKAGKK